ncbi:MAG: L-seryl-tRNA(Sec) selenium transferase [Chloroflexi bacterium]|nr:MAG: L-seryl-tRNA(Sec) selenium transferase [Chloroflexota bacterium]
MNDLSRLPSVDQLLSSPTGKSLVGRYGHQPTVQAVRESLDQIRQAFLARGTAIPDQEEIMERIRDHLKTVLQATLIPVINASGVIIHTNLGRAPLSKAALAAVKGIGGGYSTLEFNLDTGTRGSRLLHAQSQFKQLLGVEAALVVNNNASAVLLALTALTQGRKVIISRSQLVEIGGGFRIPEVLRHSGTELVEVGTTNKVHLFDYENAFSSETAAVMRAHTSNYSIVGFTSEPDLKDIVASAQQAGLWFFDDLGSGALLDTALYGLKHEPMVQESLAAGADLVCFSGDKLLGGPQAGIILGKGELIERLKVHPLARAIRADKMALAALTATMDHYLKEEALRCVPVWRMISSEIDQIRERAESWHKAIKRGEVLESRSMVGGGSLPGETLPTWVLSLEVEHPNQMLDLLRQGSPPVIGRVENDRVLFDPRTVDPDFDADFINTLEQTWRIYEK